MKAAFPVPLGQQLGAPEPWAVIFVRLMVGAVFLSEGIQKFLYPAVLGAGRFATIGIPWPQVTAPFVASVEIVGGLLVLIGLVIRFAATVLLLDISVAIVSTKIPILLGHGFWLFSVAKLQRCGFWSAIHEARVDLCMWLGCAFLIAVGGGTVSFDARRSAAQNPSTLSWPASALLKPSTPPPESASMLGSRATSPARCCSEELREAQASPGGRAWHG